MAVLVKAFEVSVSTGGFEVHRFNGDDGFPTAVVADVVWLTLPDGREFYLPNLRGGRGYDEDGFMIPPRETYLPAEKAEAVRRRGVVNLDLWVQVESVSLQDRWAEDAEREAMERAGFLA